MSDTEQTAGEPLVEALTRREREILGLLDQGLSAPEIAERLTLAPSSVKWYVQQLYGKLGVNRRHQALVRARALGLLESSLPPSPAGTSPGPKHNLPGELTRFFGRETEITQLKAFLSENRLVTITGPGGVGKTRLALRVASDLAGAYQDGVWLAALAPLASPVLVEPEVAAILGVRSEADRPLVERLIAFLRHRQTLLILDNCEHVLGACARLSERLLSHCPHLTILATSREPLNGSGEAAWVAPSLAYPDTSQPLSVEQIMASPSVRLLADRARLTPTGYRVADGDANWLARICERLDGVPLALEMAAARLNLLSAEQLCLRLDDAFAVLTGGRRTALPRQQTLHATIDWSYQLLTEEERLLLTRLAVFAGGCSLEAVEGVCAGEGLASGRILEALASLVAKSMVVAEPEGSETRFRLLEMVRQFAQAQLDAAGQTARLRRQHCDYFLKYLTVTVPERIERGHPKWGDYLPLAELDNLRLALEWAFSDTSQIEAGPQLVLYVAWRWPDWQEFVYWCRRSVAHCQSLPNVPPKLYADLLALGANALILDYPAEAIDWAERAVAIGRTFNDDLKDIDSGKDRYLWHGKDDLLWYLYRLAELHLVDLRQTAAAQAWFAEADALLLSLQPEKRYSQRVLIGNACWWEYAKGELARQQGRFEAAKMHARESIRNFDLCFSRDSSFRPVMCLAQACLALNEFDQARAYMLEAMHLHDHTTMGIGLQERATAIRGLGLIDLKQGQLDRALDYCHDALRLATVIPDRNNMAAGLELAARIAAAQDQLLRAATLAGATAALWRRQGRKPWDDCSLDTLIPGWQDRPDQPAQAAAYAAGQALDADQAVAFALDGATISLQNGVTVTK